MRMILLLIVAAFLLASCAPQTPREPAINTLTETEIAEGWKLLFNGKDLTNWKIYNGGEVSGWKIDNGWPGSLDPTRLSGANYAMHAPSGGKVNPVEEWNVTRMIVNGPHVEHWLNGVKVVEYELWSDQWLELKAAGKWAKEEYYGAATQGHIGLQDHGGLTMFRNIKIREL